MAPKGFKKDSKVISYYTNPAPYPTLDICTSHITKFTEVEELRRLTSVSGEGEEAADLMLETWENSS